MQDGVISFVIVGAKNSGKTVFLSTLFGQEDAFVSANKKTKEYLEANWKRLKKGKTPSATSGIIKRLDFQYKGREHTASFAIDDYDGYFVETLSDEALGDNPNNPTAKAGSDQIVGDKITFYGSGSFDPDGSIVSYQWELRHKENSLYNKTAVGETATVTDLKKGFYDVTLTVTDDTGATGDDDMFFSAIGDPTEAYDINGDGKAGLAEVIYFLQTLAGKR